MLLCAMSWETHIKNYQSYLRIERGLSANSIANYTFDVERLRKYLSSHDMLVSPLTIDDEVLQAFIYAVSQEVNARSQARMISGLKSFIFILLF